MTSELEQARDKLTQASRVAVITGAGVSAESGIPTFRDIGGLWEQYDVTQVATPEAFARDPELVWRFYNERRCRFGDCQPNPGHRAIARMEQRFPEFLLITQNIDDLHEKAGSRKIAKMHGSIWHVCPPEDLDDWRENRDTPLEEIPLRDEGGNLLRPAVVWFGEMLPSGELETATSFLQQSPDVVIVAGTASQIAWVPAMVMEAKQRGASIIEVNKERTDLSPAADIALEGKSGEILPELVNAP